MTPPTVNAYYNPAMNEIVFPAGILQPPFFSRAGPDAVNFGAIGMVMGHELTHGFDDEGRQFDAEGNLRDWWTRGRRQGVRARGPPCVADQYDGYAAVDDVKVNGKLTLGENIADLGGLKLRHAAYRGLAPGKPAGGAGGRLHARAAVLPRLRAGLVHESGDRRSRGCCAATDPHSPPQWRVNGPLSNLPEFRQAFSCPAESPMVRAGAKQCQLW